MSRDEILATLAGIVDRVVDRRVDPAEVKGDAGLARDLGLGSMELSEMLFEVEEAFGIEIDDEEAMTIKEVDDMVRLIEAKAT